MCINIYIYIHIKCICHTWRIVAVSDSCTPENSSIGRLMNQPCIKVNPGNGKFGSFLQVQAQKGWRNRIASGCVGRIPFLLQGPSSLLCSQVEIPQFASAHFLCIPQFHPYLGERDPKLSCRSPWQSLMI